MKNLLLIMACLVGTMACNSSNEKLTENPITLHSEYELIDYRDIESHQEFDIVYPTNGTSLAGTLYLPKGNGPYPVILFHFGSNAWERRNTPIGYPTNLFHGIKVGVFVYDRRGLGQSGGICCDADIELLADDVIAGVEALSNIPQVDVTKIGAFGFSQGGWVVPHAAAQSDKIAYTIVGSGGAVSMGEEALYSKITGDDECESSHRSIMEIDEIMALSNPSGFDPEEDLIVMQQPAYWYYGDNDTSHPIRQAIHQLNQYIETYGKNWHIELFNNANHEFFLGAGACVSTGELADTFTPLSQWLLATLAEL